MSRAAFNALNAGAALFALAACASGGGAPDSAPLPDRPAPAAAEVTLFACEGGARVAVLEREARVLDGEAALRLPRTPSASGLAYDDGAGNAFRAEGGEGMLSRDGGAPAPCRPDADEDGPALPLTARASGWTVRVSRAAVAIETRDGVFAGPAGQPERRGRIAQWTTSTSGGPLSVRLRPGPCSAAGALPAPYFADVEFGGSERRGCGGDPAEVLAGTWRLDGATPTLTFGEDGTLSGDTGCNRLSGTYDVAGGRLVVGPLRTTRMACPSGAAREARMLGSLEGATGFELTREGELVLTGDAGELFLVRAGR